MLLTSNPNDTLCSTMTSGFMVYIHNSTLHPFTDNLGYKVAPGFTTELGLSQVTQFDIRHLWFSLNVNPDFTVQLYNVTCSIR